MTGMTGFMSKFGSKDRDSKPKLSYTSFDDKTEDHSDDMKSFVENFSTFGDEYTFDFKNDDGTTETVKIRFDKRDHVYYRAYVPADGSGAQWIKVPGCTTILGIKDKSQALMPWAANETASFIKAEFLDLEDDQLATIQQSAAHMQEWLFATVDLAAKNFRNLSSDATNVGRAAHDWLEDYVNAQIAKDTPLCAELMGKKNELEDRAISCCEAALSWMQAHNVRWLYTERKIYSRNLDVAGTLDGVCYVDSCNDPECCPQPFKDRLSIIDWKSSNQLNETYRWQTAAYKFAIIEELGLPIEDCWIIKLGKHDGSFDHWHILAEDYEMDLRAFKACQELYNAADHCVQTLRDRRRASKAKAKAESEAKEAAEKAERSRVRQLKKEARAERKEVYKRHRAAGLNVAGANLRADAWLTVRFAELGTSVDDDLEELKEAA